MSLENKKISLVVDNPSWIKKYVLKFCDEINKGSNNALFFSEYEKVQKGDIAFYLGCIKKTPKEILLRNKINLVVHESALPKGRGFSPVTWQILEGKNEIPIHLIEMSNQIDEGNIILSDKIILNNYDLINDIRRKQWNLTKKLCKKYLFEKYQSKNKVQFGKPTYYKKRNKDDSELDISKSIKSQFNLLRVVDNLKYPAFFKIHGKKYIIKIFKKSD
jgi:methionyl-tRNA formyltransferase